MMYLPQKTVKLLEFDKIRTMLCDCARTEGARAAALELAPEDDLVRVLNMQRRTTDAKRIAAEKGHPPFGGVKDITGHCDRADKGAMLTGRELLDIADVLRTSRVLLDYSRQNRRFETVLDEVFERLLPDKKLEDRIRTAIISEDTLADDASPELYTIRRKLRQTTAKVRDILSKYTTGAYSKSLQENIVTIRNGRFVVPVKAECKNEIKGLVHDASSTGATLFIEPLAVVDANNEIRELEAQEKHEIERILYSLSADVAAVSDKIRYNGANIDELAFVFACAELSFKMNGSQPRISSDDRRTELRRARHPLIPKEKVVPVDIRIGGDFDTLVITGPNTGGKTVTLKTLGLFALMAQSGLHLPCDDNSTVPIYGRVLVDLGDEQSIEQSLSTFSSHMVNIVSIVDDLTDDALVLFDELGVGTDPIEGAALAIAVISEVRAAGAICAATTHYAELKAYALNTPGVKNASCEFDIETLRPTYKLTIGTPGRSNALAISERLGLPKHIIDRALAEVSSDDRRFEDVIDKLEAARIEAERYRDEAEKMRTEYEHFKLEAETKIREKIAAAEKEVERAQKKAAEMVEGAKISSEYVFAQLDKVRKAKDSERLGEELDAARKRVREHMRRNEDKFNPVDENVDEDYVLPRPLKKGDAVYLMNISQEGVVISDPDRSGNVSVQIGSVRTKTKVKNLKLMDDVITVTDSQGNKKTVKEFAKTTVSRACSDEIDLRGMNGDEAWYEVDRYLDEVQLAGLRTVRLIHGKGTGALRAALWERLRCESRIANFRIGQYGEGDGGVTVVEMK
ncbi:MAG: endonuclease MutS2 [Eubacteriales bacterium]